MPLYSAYLVSPPVFQCLPPPFLPTFPSPLMPQFHFSSLLFTGFLLSFPSLILLLWFSFVLFTPRSVSPLILVPSLPSLGSSPCYLQPSSVYLLHTSHFPPSSFPSFSFYFSSLPLPRLCFITHLFPSFPSSSLRSLASSPSHLFCFPPLHFSPLLTPCIHSPGTCLYYTPFPPLSCFHSHILLL